MKKKLCSMLLALTLLAAPLVGCGAGNDGSGGSSTGDTADGTSAAAGGPSDNFNETGYPIVNEPITLKVMLCVRDIDTLIEINDMPAIQKLEELTGVHAEFEVIKANDWDTKLNLAFASGEYPDVIISNNGRTIDFEEYGVTQEILLPLDDLIEKYMPIYSERVAGEEEDILLGMQATDGKIYSVGSLMAQNINTSAHYFINQTWLDALGLDQPTDIDSLTEVLRAFKTGDPNGNGEADEIPYQLMLEDETYGVRAVLPFFGIPATIYEKYLYLYLDEDKEVQFIPYAEGFRDAMEWLHMLYAEGLLDPEVISQDVNLLSSKLEEGNVGFFHGWRLTAMNYSDWAAENCVVIDPPAAEGYSPKVHKTLELASKGNGAFVTATNQHIPETMRWLDAMLETEMMFSLAYGMEGEGWSYNDDGLIVTVESYAEEQLMRSLFVNALFFAPAEYYFSVYENQPHRVEKMEYCQQYTEGGYVQTHSNQLLVLAPRSSDEIAQCSLIETDIHNAIEQNMAAFITQGVTDESWDAFLQIFENMDIQGYMSIYQNALDNSGF